MSGFVKEFKEFIMKGNVVDLAVGMVIGAAFKNIVTVFVSKVLTPPLGLLMGGVDFKDLRYILQAAGADGKGEVAIFYGEFIQVIIDFIIVALAIFCVVKGLNNMKKKEAEAPEEPAPTPQEQVLLAEIRDLLKK